MTDVYFDNARFDLTTRDMWLRQRNNSLELKWPMVLEGEKVLHKETVAPHELVGLDFYMESTNESTISEALLKHASITVPLNLVANNSTSTEVSLKQSVQALNEAGVNALGTILTERTRFNLSMNLPAELGNMYACERQSIDYFVDIDEVKYQLPSEGKQPDYAGQIDCSYQIGEVEFNFSADADSNDFPVTMDITAGMNAAIMQHVFKELGIHPAPVRGKVLEYLFRFRPLHYEALRECGQLASKGL